MEQTKKNKVFCNLWKLTEEQFNAMNKHLNQNE